MCCCLESLDVGAAYQGFVTLPGKKPKRPSHEVIETIIFCVEMRSVNPSTQRFCSLLRQATQLRLLQLYRKIDGPNQFGSLSTMDSCASCQVGFCQLLFRSSGIASRLVRNGKYEAVDRRSFRLAFQEVPYLWRAITTNPVNISETFSQSEFTAGLQHLKPGRTPDPNSIFQEVKIYVRTTLKSCICDFLSSFRFKISKIWRKAVSRPQSG